MEITKMLSKNTHHSKGWNPCNYITIHETANTAKGATAVAHGRYMNNGSAETWHFTVDEHMVIQHFNTRVQCWHCGDGGGKGNMSSIGVELCVNSGSDFNKTVDNAVWLIKKLMKQHNIKIDNVVQHNKWSGKNCPTNLRNGSKGVTWNYLKSQLRTVTKNVSNVKTKVTNNIATMSIDDLVKNTLNGKYGNGDKRRKLLGSRYTEVQKRINKM